MTRFARAALTAIVVAVGGGACSASGRHAAPSTVTTVAPVTTTTTTVPGAQTTGPRTVLSPTGLRLRAQPSTAAPVLGTAGQGAVLDVLSHTLDAGGWYQVKGATVTGWVSDNPALSAPGMFQAYTSNPQFGALYPTAWTVSASPPGGATFGAPANQEMIVVTTAASVGQLGRGQPGYRSTRSEQVVVCGVTASLITYTRSGALPPTGSGPAATTVTTTSGVSGSKYLAQIRVTVDAQHALGVDGNLSDLSQLQAMRDFVNSVTFPSPQCQH